MGGLLDKTKTAVEIMSERAIDILKDLNIDSGFLIQYAIFRNYNAP